MKIQSWSGASYLSELKRQTPDRDPDGRAPPEKRDQKEEEKNPEANFEAVMTLAEELSKDPQTSELGITASVENQGPGLRVTLKDGSGAVVRQLSGEEFMRTRLNAGAGRGKLLDRKG